VAPAYRDADYTRMRLHAGLEMPRGDTFRVGDDTGVERLRSTLRRYTGSILAGGHFPGSRLELSRSRGGRFACRDEGAPDTAALGVLKDNPTRARMEQP